MVLSISQVIPYSFPPRLPPEMDFEELSQIIKRCDFSDLGASRLRRAGDEVENVFAIEPSCDSVIPE